MRFDLLILPDKLFLLEIRGTERIKHGPFRDVFKALDFIRKRERESREALG
jgi:hypothetical protein